MVAEIYLFTGLSGWQNILVCFLNVSFIGLVQCFFSADLMLQLLLQTATILSAVENDRQKWLRMAVSSEKRTS